MPGDAESQPQVPLESLALPEHARLVRTTKEFTEGSVPAGLLRAHRVAPGVWGRLCVLDGQVTFVEEASGEARVVGAGASQVIRPDTPHHVEPGTGARFVVEFHE